MTDTLRAAAQAVVDRWDTPLWKDVPATAEYIGRLRASLAASAGSEPMFWVRLLRDGLYEGPVHHKSVGGKMLRDEKPGEWTPLYTQPSPTTQVAQADSQPAPDIDALCARIKAADDAAADRDYMLDSDDCIKVLRGEWKAPLAMDKPDRAARASADSVLEDAAQPELDTWKCERCHGKGWYWQSESVTHGKEIGVENVDLKTSCDACEGVGWCGPDDARKQGGAA